MGEQRIFEEMKNIQEILLDFLDNENEVDGKFQNIKQLIDDLKICEQQHKFRILLRMIAKISKNHHRYPNVISKIEQILTFYKDDITKKFTNSDIFNIFNGNKRILLFLINEKMIILDESIAEILATEPRYLKKSYLAYFSPEIKQSTSERWYRNNLSKLMNEDFSEDFYNYRKIGENHENLCKIIREDSIDNFIIYVNQRNISLKSNINQSIFETNNFLLNKNVTLIEYAAFFGSIRIFKYLKMNEVELTPNLWIFAIHSKNAELIYLLDEYKVMVPYNEYIRCIHESMKCFHIDLFNYFKDNFINDNIKTFSLSCFYEGAKYDNYFNFLDSFKKIGASINNFFSPIKSIQQINLLHFAIENENIDVIKLILTNDKINLNDAAKIQSLFNSKAPLFLAIEKENIEIIKLLLANQNIDANLPSVFLYIIN